MSLINHFLMLQTGVTPLPDNDSRDTYCYEIQVHTGFIRGAGSSAEVSIVLTGALGDSEPRVLKDPKRKTFKTGKSNSVGITYTTHICFIKLQLFILPFSQNS